MNCTLMTVLFTCLYETLDAVHDIFYIDALEVLLTFVFVEVLGLFTYAIICYLKKYFADLVVLGYEAYSPALHVYECRYASF